MYKYISPTPFRFPPARIVSITAMAARAHPHTQLGCSFIWLFHIKILLTTNTHAEYIIFGRLLCNAHR